MTYLKNEYLNHVNRFILYWRTLLCHISWFELDTRLFINLFFFFYPNHLLHLRRHLHAIVVAQKSGIIKWNYFASPVRFGTKLQLVIKRGRLFYACWRRRNHVDLMSQFLSGWELFDCSLVSVIVEFVNEPFHDCSPAGLRYEFWLMTFTSPQFD